MTETAPKCGKHPNPDQPMVSQIVEALGETAGRAEDQIRRIVRPLGPEQALALLARTEEVEAAGGMLVPDGSRRRTEGGVFFRLVKDRLTPAQRLQLFPPWNTRQRRPGGPAQPR
jgi:hypothetical protein